LSQPASPISWQDDAVRDRSTTSGKDTSRTAEPNEALRLLFWLRTVAIAAQVLVIAAVHTGLDIELPLGSLALVIFGLVAWNAAVFWRLRRLRDVSHAEVAFNLVVDIGALTAVIYLTGGPTNPFVSLYLVPIALAATSLPARFAWAIGALCGAGYSLLLVRHVPLPSVHSQSGGDFDLHVLGMWVNFLVAFALIVFFVGRMARLLRERDQEIALMREAALRDQQIVALGALAAGTAHELNTPLSTLMLLVEELEETSRDEVQKRQLRVMTEQIDVISQRLDEIARRTGAERSEGASRVGLRVFLETLVAEWRAAHPGMTVRVSFELPEPDMMMVAEVTIKQAIRNVLDNAAYATRASGHSDIEIVGQCSNGKLTVTVLDSGTGIQPELRDGIGLGVRSTKERGLGIGLLLSKAALQRFGGDLELRDRDAGGVAARIDLPLEGLVTDAG
jgi:two-component system, sensor histidine kinase RegB